jgi:hypothetical protein
MKENVRDIIFTRVGKKNMRKGKLGGGGGDKKINERQKDRNVRTKIDNVNGTRVQMNINNDIYCVPNG